MRAYRLQVTRESDAVECPHLTGVFHRVFPVVSRRLMRTREPHSVMYYGQRYLLERVGVPMRTIVCSDCKGSGDARALGASGDDCPGCEGLGFWLVPAEGRNP